MFTLKVRVTSWSYIIIIFLHFQTKCSTNGICTSRLCPDSKEEGTCPGQRHHRQGFCAHCCPAGLRGFHSERPPRTIVPKLGERHWCTWRDVLCLSECQSTAWCTRSNDRLDFFDYYIFVLSVLLGSICPAYSQFLSTFFSSSLASVHIPSKSHSTFVTSFPPPIFPTFFPAFSTIPLSLLYHFLIYLSPFSLFISTLTFNPYSLTNNLPLPASLPLLFPLIQSPLPFLLFPSLQ